MMFTFWQHEESAPFFYPLTFAMFLKEVKHEKLHLFWLYLVNSVQTAQKKGPESAMNRGLAQ